MAVIEESGESNSENVGLRDASQTQTSAISNYVVTGSAEELRKNICELPSDLVLSILERLPTKHLYHLRCVSRHFREMIDSIYAVRSNIRRLVTRRVLTSSPLNILEFSVHNEDWTVAYKYWKAFYSNCLCPDPITALRQTPIADSFGFPIQSCNVIICLGSDDGHVILFNPATEQLVPLPYIGGVYQCIGVADSDGQYKVVLWYLDPWGNSLSAVLTVGAEGWRPFTSPMYRVLCGRVPFIEGSLHVFPRDIGDGALRSLERILAFHARTERYVESLRFPESYYSSAEPVRARNLFDMHDCLSLCITRNDRIEMWRVANYDTVDWIKENDIRLSLPLYLPETGPTQVDPLASLNDDNLVMNVLRHDNVSEVRTYNQATHASTSTGLADCSVVYFTERIFDLGGNKRLNDHASSSSPNGSYLCTSDHNERRIGVMHTEPESELY